MAEAFKLIERRDPFRRIPDIAERLGVKEGQNLGEVDVCLKDGRKYSLFDLALAFLDKMHVVSVNQVTLKYPDGETLLAGDLVEGSQVTFDPSTGVVSKIVNPT